MNRFKNKNYLNITYSEKMAPKSSYPDKLGAWIAKNIFKRRGKIIDLGCGRGDYLESFEKLEYDICGVDISSKIEELSKKYNVDYIDFDQNDGLETKYDFVFSKSVIEHLKTPDNLFSTAYDCLNSEGVAVIMTPSWEYNNWGPFYFDHTHITPFTKISLKNALHIAGFKDVKVYYFYQLPILWKYPFLKPLIKILQWVHLPYRPFSDAPWPLEMNKLIRFSKEVMLLAVAKKD